MSDSTITQRQQEAFVSDMSHRMIQMAQRLSDWAKSSPQSLGDMEQMTLQALHELGGNLLAGLCSLSVPAYPVEQVPCACGQAAGYERLRWAHMQTLLGSVELNRPYYLCPSCHHGLAPLDQQLGFCAGGLSAALDEILALLGTQFTFEQASAMTQKLTLVTICPNSVKAAAESLGQQVVAADQQAIAQAWAAQPTLPPAPTPAPERLYVSMDGVIAHVRALGWKEVKLGAIYSTVSRVPKQRPQALEVRAADITFYSDIADYATFGQGLWLEAYRRGVTQAKELIVIGDGAHWIWDLVQEHFPDAIQIVDWYHASQYIWNVAHAVYGQGTDLAKHWANQRLDELWNGQCEQVMQHFQTHATTQAAQEALTYYTHNQPRMRYPEYRAQGLQIGSGTIESGCKHVIGARLKQAGMLWSLAGAQAIAKLRARFKSHRWDETIALRQPPHRSYQRKVA